MQKTTRATRRRADAMRHKIYPSRGMRAAWIAGPNGESVFAMVPHSTPTARMMPEWSATVLEESMHRGYRKSWLVRFQRNDWRDRRAEERYDCRLAREFRDWCKYPFDNT